MNLKLKATFVALATTVLVVLSWLVPMHSLLGTSQVVTAQAKLWPHVRCSSYPMPETLPPCPRFPRPGQQCSSYPMPETLPPCPPSKPPTKPRR